MSEDRKSILIFGLGARGLDTYARYLASNAPSVEVVGVADPNPAKLEAARTLFPSLPDHRVQSDWRPLLAQGRIADRDRLRRSGLPHPAGKTDGAK